MKITKAMVRAAMRELKDGRVRRMATEAIDEMAWDDGYLWSSNAHVFTALAMCAAIAGVKPEDVE